MGRHLARASEANAALLGSLAALAGPGADQLALPDASAQGGPRIAQASRYHRETCPDRDDAARVGARLEGLGARSRRHCQRSRAFGCSAYRQSGTAEIDQRRPKMQPTFFSVEPRGGPPRAAVGAGLDQDDQYIRDALTISDTKTEPWPSSLDAKRG